ncbi:osmostress-responsive transcription [Colletotrichum truncatum]|uniref:Osmostress-responsive transcription n=1 Tax=Colletotrichum truncatum TaxID=5467 RepID=A0ACC3YPY1_COLTU|nr:osmostress-responsive transcription [Colletotrichum truncatum]KAF6796788.1 osmostress-responsive transcription [Colletotrichum truncatum]
MRDLQLFSSRSKSVGVPPHPSHSPSVSVPAHIPSQSQASRLPTLSRVELPPIKHAIGGAEESISIVTSTTTLPQRIISTGKKAPRSKGASNHRSYQPGKKSTAAYASKQTTHSRPAARKNTVREEIKASHIAKRRLELPQNISTNKERPTVEPQNPYDDPKYFSPLTVLTEDGTKQPIFKFHQHPDTVEEQWAEYKYGLHGQPPVEQLEAKYRAKWRNNDYGRSWFTRRKPFWDKIKEAMAEGKTEAEALNLMRDLANGRVKSLIGQLCDERASKRRRLEKMQKGRSRASRKKWSEARKEEVVDSAEEESVGADSKTNAVVLRKRIKQFKAWAGVDESESDTISKKDADELWSE